MLVKSRGALRENLSNFLHLANQAWLVRNAHALRKQGVGIVIFNEVRYFICCNTVQTNNGDSKMPDRGKNSKRKVSKKRGVAHVQRRKVAIANRAQGQYEGLPAGQLARLQQRSIKPG